LILENPKRVRPISSGRGEAMIIAPKICSSHPIGRRSQLKNKRNFFLQKVSCQNYTIFEMDLLFEKKRIRIIDSGLKIEEYDLNEFINGKADAFEDCLYLIREYKY